jgi:glycosyltransferase involved in cell wall biosynthesis
MRIGLNLLHALPEIGGGWNYIGNLLKALASVDNDNEYVSFVTDASKSLVPDKANFHLVYVGINATNRLRRILYEQTTLHLLARRHRLDLMHWFAGTRAFFNAATPAITIYDLQVFRNRNAFSRAQGLYLRTMITHASRGSLLLPMSRTTAQDLHSILNVRAENMAVIPAPIPDEFRPLANEAIQGFKTKYHLPENFWLYVAHYNPHKNHRRLLEAYALLKDSVGRPWPLVLRGDIKNEKGIDHYIQEFGLQQDVIQTSPLANDEMPLLFNAATAVISPSTFEGGGMPLMEAMSCGCPVAASDIPTTKEFGGDAVLSFNPLDAAAIMESMYRFQTTPELRTHHRQAGLVQSSRFSMRSIGLELVRAYQRAHLRN